MDAVPRLIPTPLRSATFQTMIGLLAATGMRVGEAIDLRRVDIDWANAVIDVRAAKFNKSRELALEQSSIDALRDYAVVRDRAVARPSSPTFFLSSKGTPVIYTDFGFKFRELVRTTGVGAGSPTRPRIHDYPDLRVIPTSGRRRCSAVCVVSSGRHNQRLSKNAMRASGGR